MKTPILLVQNVHIHISMYSTWFLVYINMDSSLYKHEPLSLVAVNIISIRYINRIPPQLFLSPCSYRHFYMCVLMFYCDNRGVLEERNNETYFINTF